MTLPPDVPGEVLGHRVIGVLGAGATARVLLAVTPDGREVALKRVHPHLAPDADARARLRREAENLVHVAGEGVVELLRVLEGERDLALVLRLERGPSLARVLDEARARSSAIPRERALAWARSTLRALARMHAAGVVHADVNPRNVLTRDEGGVVLVDFGFAGPPSGSGPLRGTIGYLAPEQAAGGASPASDVYAAGVMLWELLRLERYRQTTNPAALLAALPGEAPRALDVGRPDLATYAGPVRALLATAPLARPTARDAAALLSGFG